MKMISDTRITESELVLPSLLVLDNIADGAATTSDLIVKLRELLRPSGEDLKILSGRLDDKFSQKVRNIVSHNTLGREKYATHVGGVFHITRKGREYLKEKYDVVEYLITNDFKWEDLKKGFIDVEENKKEKIEVFDENIVINEGFKKAIISNMYERSKKLRDEAIKKYKDAGIISCNCCNFNFDKFYGKKTGAGYIEVHHIKPIFKYQNQDLKKFIKDALENLRPVCSNCHRMIHRNWKRPLEITTIQKSISENGVFCRN